MGFLSVLKRIGRGAATAAPVAAAVYAPAALPVIDLVVAAVKKAEADFEGAGRGAEKLAAVMDNMAQSLPLIAAYLEHSSGYEVVNEDELRLALMKYAQATVHMQNAVTRRPGD